MYEKSIQRELSVVDPIRPSTDYDMDFAGSAEALIDIFGRIPEAGAVYAEDELAGKQIPDLVLPSYNVKCRLCGKIFYQNSYTSTKYRVMRESDLENHYYICLAFDNGSSSFTVSYVKPLKDAVGPGKEIYRWNDDYLAVDTEVAALFSHQYSVSTHSHTTECLERYHAHASIWDNAEHEYTCDCTNTYYDGTTSEVVIPVSKSSCDHKEYYFYREYFCCACGQELYYQYYEGCKNRSCGNYYKAINAEGEYVRYSYAYHPGVHTYTAVGERYSCSGTSTIKVYSTDDEPWYHLYNYPKRPDSATSEDYVYYACKECGAFLYMSGSDKRYISDVSFYNYCALTGDLPTTHYYYVRGTKAGSCYEYGEPHSARYTQTAASDNSKCSEHTANTYYDVYKSYTCKECGQVAYNFEKRGCSSCDDLKEEYSKGRDVEELGIMTYYSSVRSEDNEINTGALHSEKKLVCHTAEYGDYICDKVVISLVPLSPEQSIMADGNINTKAYAKFLDGHMELVECSLAEYDADKYNEWQTATLAYGEYSSVSSKTPQTAEIQIYVERINFDLTAVPQDSSMGSVEGSGSYTAGTEAKVSVTEGIGYYFTGWYENGVKVSDEKEYSFAMPGRDVSLVAKFAPYVYFLTAAPEYPSMGTVSVTANGQPVGSMPYNGKFVAKAVPAEGFTFAGWYDGTKLLGTKPDQELSMPAYDLNLIAKFDAGKVSVYFDSDGGSACGSMQVPYLGVYGNLPIPSKEGYVFYGWKLGSSYITAASPVTAKASHTLKAEWVEAGPEFIMVDFGNIYGDNSWSSDSTQIGKLGLTSANFRRHLPYPSKTGYSFLNWYLTENSRGNGDSLGNPDNEVEAGTVVKIDENHSLHAGWKEKSFTLSFESFGGSACAPVTVSYDRSWEYHGALPVPEKSGYTFAGWHLSYLDGNGTGIRINVNDGENDTRRVEILEDTTVYAKWLKEANYRNPMELVVSFEPKTREQKGLTLEESREKGYGSTFGTMDAEHAKRNVTWPGTYGNYTLAWCGCGEESHDVYPEYGGRHYMIDYNSSHEAFPAASRIGYDFTGWEYDGLPVAEETTVQAAFDHTLYASYKAKTYTVVLDGRGADTQPQMKVIMTFDKKAPNVGVPAKEGYLFGGYYTKADGAGAKYYDENGHSTIIWDSNSLNANGTQKISTLYAYWQPVTKISYEPNGGTGTMNPVWLYPGVTSTDISSNGFTRTGYSFTGWNTKADGSGTSYYEGQHVEGITSNLTLYAQWEMKTNRIVFRGNGGTGSMADVVTAEAVTSAALPENAFTRTGYIFNGWNTKADGSGTSYADKATVSYFKDTLVLFAQWKEVNISYTLVYMKYPLGSAENEIWKKAELSYKQEHTIAGAPYTPESYVVDYDLNRTENMSTEPKSPMLEEENCVTEAAQFDKWNLYYLYNGTPVAAGKSYSKDEAVSKLTETDGDVLYLYPGWQGANDSVVLPETECEGYEFLGWCEKADGSGKMYTTDVDGDNDGKFTPVKDIMLYAIWKPLTKTIQLEAACRGEEPDEHTQREVIFTFDEEAPFVVIPEKENYVFLGYYTDLDNEGSPSEESKRIYGADGSALCEEQGGFIITNNENGTFDIVDTLYAYWIPAAVEVDLDERGATSEGHTKTVKMRLGEPGPEIIVPEKRGYVFQGYYTEIRGNGEKYYDSHGFCVKPWQETEKRILYAFWKQEDVKKLVPIEKKLPEILPEMDIKGTLGEKAPVALLYADDYNPETGALTDLQPYLAYDTEVSTGAIPGTEQVAFRAKLSSWLLEYQFHRYSGMDIVRICVMVPYRTQYERDDETLVISEIQTRAYIVEVPKAWSYWTVEKSGLFYPEKVKLSNAALKEQEAVLEVLEGDILPECLFTAYGTKEKHVLWENYGVDNVPELTLVLEEQYIISEEPECLPDVESYLRIVCENAAWQDASQPMVRSDRYMLAGKEILPDGLQENGNGGEPDAALLEECRELAAYTKYEQTYLAGLELNPYKENGIYETEITAYYTGADTNINVAQKKEFFSTDVNSLRIHTPVVCVGKVSCEEKTEEFATEGITALFTVETSNTGTHVAKLGYGTRNFRLALSGSSNVAETEKGCWNLVRFPFDVMLDVGNDATEFAEVSLDVRIEQGTWIILGTRSQQFYSTEQLYGTYEIEFCTIAANCPKDENGNWIIHDNVQEYANTDSSKYVATNRIFLEIKGKPEKFLITGTDSLEAGQLLMQGEQALTLKKGYGFSYTVLTKEGLLEESAGLDCIPSFYWVSGDGQSREQVKLYCPAMNLYEKVRLKQGAPENGYQVWMGEFFLPEGTICVSLEDVPGFEAYAAVQTVTGKEGFFKQDGYLVVQFALEGQTAMGEVYSFSKWKDTELAEDALAAGWNYKPGDVVRYNLAESIRDDYEIGGVE